MANRRAALLDALSVRPGTSLQLAKRAGMPRHTAASMLSTLYWSDFIAREGVKHGGREYPPYIYRLKV